MSAAAYRCTAAACRFRHLARIASTLPFAEALMVQTLRDPRDLAHAVASVLIIGAVGRLFAARSTGA